MHSTIKGFDMPIFIQMLSFQSSTQRFNERKDTGKINEALKKLQEMGAKIIDIKVSIGGGSMSTAAVYIITYEADKPLVI